MRLGCDIWLSRPLRRWIKFAAGLGLTDVEIICDRDDDGTTAHHAIPHTLAEEARMLAADAGITLGVAASVYNFAMGDPSPQWAARSADAVRRALEFAAAAGAVRVTVRTDADAGLTQGRRRDRFLTHAEALAPDARAAGITLALENFHDPVPLYLALLEAPALAGWAALWNVAHAHAFGGPIGQKSAIGLLARRPAGLAGFALSDNRGQKDDHLAIGRGGRAGVDVRGFLRDGWARHPELPVFLELHDGVALTASVKTVRRWAGSFAPPQP